MRTIDIVNTGVDRNFLRECERQNLIMPERLDGEDIVNKNYKPREYSQKDLEIVWNAYLYRKMGLSYEQIKQLISGENLPIRNSIIELIKKYEQQVKELLLLIDFLKYVKGLGFIPKPPQNLMRSENFVDYLSTFIDYFDPNKDLKKYLKIIEELGEVNVKKVNEEKINEIISAINDITPSLDFDDEILETIISKLKNVRASSPDSAQVQEVMNELYECHKKITSNNDVTVWDFASGYIYLFSVDSDFKAMIVNTLGEDFLNFFISALSNFLVIQEPEKIRELFQTEDCE